MRARDRIKQAREQEVDFERRVRRPDDFRYDEYQAKYWDITTGFLLVAASVDSAIAQDLWSTRRNRDDE